MSQNISIIRDELWEKTLPHLYDPLVDFKKYLTSTSLWKTVFDPMYGLSLAHHVILANDNRKLQAMIEEGLPLDIHTAKAEGAFSGRTLSREENQNLLEFCSSHEKWDALKMVMAVSPSLPTSPPTTHEHNLQTIIYYGKFWEVELMLKNGANPNEKGILSVSGGYEVGNDIHHLTPLETLKEFSKKIPILRKKSDGDDKVAKGLLLVSYGAQIPECAKAEYFKMLGLSENPENGSLVDQAKKMLAEYNRKHEATNTPKYILEEAKKLAKEISDRKDEIETLRKKGTFSNEEQKKYSSHFSDVEALEEDITQLKLMIGDIFNLYHKLKELSKYADSEEALAKFNTELKAIENKIKEGIKTNPSDLKAATAGTTDEIKAAFQKLCDASKAPAKTDQISQEEKALVELLDTELLIFASEKCKWNVPELTHIFGDAPDFNTLCSGQGGGVIKLADLLMGYCESHAL